MEYGSYFYFFRFDSKIARQKHNKMLCSLGFVLAS